MDKNAIKKYAVWARNELITRVAQKALQYGITEEDSVPAEADSVGGKLLTDTEKKQRQALIAQVKEKGFEQVMEEVAYTWFNRFSALRFMEVNGYLPTHVRVFTDEQNNFKPQIIAEAIHLEMDGLEMEKIYALKEADKTEELYKYLLITQCNALNKNLPGLFQRISDYTELLLPDNLLREGSVIEQMVSLILEEDWKDAVQIIGWLYQYYNTELKDKIFANLKKNIKISKENIPAATQLFTPDWIVRYMVENSLGRLWYEGHPDEVLKAKWKYYIDEAEQETEVKERLHKIREEFKIINPEKIRCIDPCMGSGHILVYMFDVLMQIYESYGYNAREAAASIVANNLYGLDIDERAAQLAYFAVMMKARQYDRRFFSREIQPHIYAIQESNGITTAPMHDLGLNLTQDEYNIAAKQVVRLVEELHDAKEFGSILNITPCDWELLRRFAVPRDENGQLMLDVHGEKEVSKRLQQLINIGEIMAQKYDVVVTNPPYMGKKSLNNKMSSFLDSNYNKGKSELYSAFILKCMNMTSHLGFASLITIHTWMFISSFEGLRNDILKTSTIISMIHTGAATFEELNSFNVLATSFCLRKSIIDEYLSKFIRLANYYSTTEKIENFANLNDRYMQKQTEFYNIPGSSIIYWISQNAINNFITLKPVSSYGDTKVGLQTAENEKFVRYWHEIEYTNFYMTAKTIEESIASRAKWFPYNKGGNFRKWYGMNEYVVDWFNDGENIRKDKLDKLQKGLCLPSNSKPKNTQYYFKSGITWSLFGFENFSVRYKKEGFIFDISGASLFTNDELELYILAFLASKIAFFYLSVLAPTVNFQAGNIGDLPLFIQNDIRPEINRLAQECIEISRIDWDDFEESWDFKKHPLCDIKSSQGLKNIYDEWSEYMNARYEKLRANEERMNAIFIDIYHLQNDVTENVVDRDIALRKADLQRDIKSLISYAVGCMFGRYSLDVEGLAYAGGEFDSVKYRTFPVDKDNIIPICDDEYFEDDIVGRFMNFVEVVYGKETLVENLKFVADALGGRGNPKDVIRSYFINDFYNDHIKMCKKRPFYWQFDSGKKNSFKCLIYMHRYQPDTIARIRTDYVHEQQARYRTAIADLEQRINDASTSDRVKLNKQLLKLKDQEIELKSYEEKVHHLADQMIRIDLDDGVKHNYEIFKDVLAKIK